MTRILLAEDEYLIRLILVEELAEQGYEVVEAASGDEAIALTFDDTAFDLLLTDIQMPGKVDGLELARALRQRQPDIPVIYVTGRPEVLDKLGYLGPRDAFVRKPYSARDVITAIRELLARVQAGSNPAGPQGV